ncbi:hypothetical protein Patl1_11039 [Pistacia atlantica]|uniref:Uncharacterized protein n=1 Tax=Pistacia atlantica TaxID=434234 RepID=A0ACC1A6L1_9ROSI|nr:hypothetical protein Patl1_11039 [Pistacia atlantica]
MANINFPRRIIKETQRFVSEPVDFVVFGYSSRDKCFTIGG